MSPAFAASAVLMGGVATLTMDGWNLFLKRALGISSLDYCLLGRWILHFREGTFRHASIRAAAPQAGECAVGWLAHYTIGIVFSLGFLVLAASDCRVRPALLPPLLYGLATVACPFLVLQPSIGLGIASSKAPHPARARMKSIATHAVFGVGLYLSELVVRYGLGVCV